ncbi:MAG TPA: GNAT family N-acetyltransferase [Solirubrobacteraceae bacterium]|jgi:ribosomal protein S18 acetylase RimI-like enzyme
MPEPPAISIRRLDPTDLNRVEPLWNALREHHASVTPAAGAPRPRADSWARRRAQYERWLSERDAFVLIAELDGAAVGYAMVHLRVGSPTWPASERAGEVETLSVLPSARGGGIGTLLLRAVEDELAELGVEEFSLHVVSNNDKAMAFYERHGLRPFAQWLSVTGIGKRERVSPS